MKLIKIDRKITTKIEQLELVITILCLVNGVSISKTDISVLAYYILYKTTEKTDNLILNSKIVKNFRSLRNIKSKLKRLGFLRRTNELYNSYEVALDKNFNVDDPEIRLLIKIDNS